MPLSEEQRRELNAPIPVSAVTQRKQAGQVLDYVEGWWVIDRINAIVGNGEWGSELVSIDHVTTVTATQDGTEKHTVTYRAVVRLHGPFATQVGVGFASNTSRSLGDAHETAGKSAETDALKRAAMRLGRHLGLALYQKPDEQGARDHVAKTHPERLGDCSSASELRSWLGHFGPKLRGAQNGQREKLLAAVNDAARKCGISEEQAMAWLGGES
jgi:hypothetical protein